VSAVGVCGEGWDGVGRFVTLGGSVEPVTANRDVYEAGYLIYRDSYERLRPTFQRPVPVAQSLFE